MLKKATPLPSTASRRKFLQSTAKTAGVLGFPLIVPASVLGKDAPSSRINVGAIGVGRISRIHDMPSVWRYDHAHIMAVCDLDSNRVKAGQLLVDTHYSTKWNRPYTGTVGYDNYKDLLANKDIDAVIISTPDHQHAILAATAIRAKKDVYLQKPAALTIAEGRFLANTVAASQQILQIGSQQRSVNAWPQFHRACELVRNGRIGKLQKVEIGLPGDPSGPEAAPMPIPAGLNYDAWLGTTPQALYTEMRVHPQNSFDRPGWLRCEQFGAGMITGWGAHHVDIAHWAMGAEHTGPVEVWGDAEFPGSGLWNVHGKFKTFGRYANGVLMTISGDFPNGIKFIGSQGWIFVTRSGAVSASNPAGPHIVPLVASNPGMLDSVIGDNETRLYRSEHHHGNWLDSIRTRKPNIATAEIGHRACSTCLLHHIAMRAQRKLHWDPVQERFINDDTANRLLAREQRAPHGFS
jgi:predicted dehydrogenase